MYVPRPRIPYFLIFYSTTFTLFTLLLAALLLITPGDHIYQAFRAGELYRIIIVGAVYVFTFLIAVCIYGARLFSTRSALANIPREWNLGGDEKSNASLGLGMSRRMNKVVRESWERSAIIAYESTPRDLKGGGQVRHIPSKKRKRRHLGRSGPRASVESVVEPVWGSIKHPGWAGPESHDLPNLHFESVIAELPSILEAKAVSLAPSGPSSYEADAQAEPAVNNLAVELLRRPRSMGLRTYTGHLQSLSVLQSGEKIIQHFLTLYEKARFSGAPLAEDEFRRLMALFSNILRDMYPLDRSDLAVLQDAEENWNPGFHAGNGSEDAVSDMTDGTTRRKRPRTQHSSSSSSESRSDEQATAHTAPSRARYSQHISADDLAPPAGSGQSVDSREQDRSSMDRDSRSGTGSRASIASSSLASSGGSVVRTGNTSAPLDLPLVFHEHIPQ